MSCLGGKKWSFIQRLSFSFHVKILKSLSLYEIMMIVYGSVFVFIPLFGKLNSESNESSQIVYFI